MSSITANQTAPVVARTWPTEHRALWWAIGIGIALRIIVLLVYAPWDAAVQSATLLIDDAKGYHGLALCVLESNGFCLHTNRTPGYPAFIAAVYALFGAQPWIVLLAHVVVDALTIALTYALGVAFFSPVVAGVAAVLLAFDPTSLFTSSSLLTDSLFTLLFLTSVALFLRAIATARLGWGLAAGVALGLAAWVRPSAQYVPILLVAAALCRIGWPWSRRLALGVLMVLAFVLTISPWLLRNHQQFGAVGLATVKGETLLNWQAAFFIAWRDHKPVQQVREELAAQSRDAGWVDGGNPFENAAIQEKVALRHIQAQPLPYAAAMLRGMGFMYLNVGSDKIAKKLGLADPDAPKSSLRNEATTLAVIERAWREKGPAQLALGAGLAAMNLLQYTLALIGLWIALRDRRYRWLALFIMLLVAYFTVTSGVSAEARYKMPVTPLYLLLAGLAVQAWARRRKA